MDEKTRIRLKKLKQERDLKIGFEKEDDFSELMKNEDGVVSVIKATTKTDMKDHWDRCFVYKDGKNIQIDIKGTKSYGDKYHTIEMISNIYQIGWVLGSADFIAFELSDKFICVDREKLANYTLKLFLSDEQIKSFIGNLSKKSKSLGEKLRIKDEIEATKSILSNPIGLTTKDGMSGKEKVHGRHMRSNWNNRDVTTVLELEEIEKKIGIEFEISKYKKI